MVVEHSKRLAKSALAAISIGCMHASVKLMATAMRIRVAPTPNTSSSADEPTADDDDDEASVQSVELSEEARMMRADLRVVQDEDEAVPAYLEGSVESRMARKS